MSSVRLDSELDARVREAARRLGLTPSEVHRRALKEFCDATLEARPGSRYRDVIGIGSGPPNLSQRTGETLVAVLEQKTADAKDSHGHSD